MSSFPSRVYLNAPNEASDFFMQILDLMGVSYQQYPSTDGIVTENYWTYLVGLLLENWGGSGPGGWWKQDGNTVGSEKWIGTIDNYTFPIRTNNTEKLAIGTSGQIYRGSGSRNLFSIAYSITNTSWGYNSGASLAGAGNVTLIGASAGTNITSGSSNTLVGYNTGGSLSTGTSNTLIGANAGAALGATATQNTFTGAGAGGNATADKNAYFGYNAGAAQTSGIFNVAVGAYAGRNFFSAYANSAANANIYIGQGAGDGQKAGSYNIFIGLSGGYNFQDGNRNILIGNTVIATSYGAGNITQPYPTSSTNDTLGFGNLVQFTASNQIVFGSATYYYTQVAYSYSSTGIHSEFFRTSTPFSAVSADRGSIAYVDTGSLGAMYINQTNTVPTNGWARVLTDNYSFSAPQTVSLLSNSNTFFTLSEYNGAYGGNNVSFIWNETSVTVGINCGAIYILGDTAIGWQIAGETQFMSSVPIIVNSTELIKGNSPFGDGSAANAGTLTNAPLAGDPTKWIPIIDNGTTRYIPAW